MSDIFSDSGLSLEEIEQQIEIVLRDLLARIRKSVSEKT
jgi:hypothetical protein